MGPTTICQIIWPKKGSIEQTLPDAAATPSDLAANSRLRAATTGGRTKEEEE